MEEDLMEKLKKIDWVNLLFLGLTPFAAGLAIYVHFTTEVWSYQLLTLFIVSYFLTGLAITAGYHRLFSHRSYKASWWVRFFYLVFGAGAFENSCLKWSADHRRHHQEVDTDNDPYNARKGFFYSHIGWVLIKEQSPGTVFPKDLLKDPLVRWQHKYYLLLAGLVGFALPTLVGFFLGAPIGGLAFGGLLRIVVVQHSTFFINSLAHMYGKSTYTDKNSAKDNLWLSFFTYGEGFHNFHHKFQIDYRNGPRWYHWDPTKWLIKTLSFFGQTDRLIKVPESDILKSKMLMEKKILLAKGLQTSRFDQFLKDKMPSLDGLQMKVEEAHLKFIDLKKEFKRVRNEIPLHGKEKLFQIQGNLKVARLEFKLAYMRWYTQRKYLLVTVS